MSLNKSLTAVLLLLTIHFPILAQKGESDWQEKLSCGRNAFASARYAEALGCFQKASQLKPTDTTAWIYIIKCGVQLHKPQLVYNAIDKPGLKALQTVEVYSLGLHMARDMQQNMDKAFVYMGKLTELAPDNRAVREEEITTYYLNEDFKKAEELTRAYLAKYPGSYTQLSLLVRLLAVNDKNYPEALFNAGLLVKSYPDSLGPKELEANVYLLKGDTLTARQKVEDILRLHPHNIKALNSLANILYQQGEYDRVIETCNEVLAIDSGNIGAMHLLGTCCYRKGLGFTRSAGQLDNRDYLFMGRDAEDSAMLYFSTARPFFEKLTSLTPDRLDVFESLNTIDVQMANMEKNRKATEKFSPRESRISKRMAPAPSKSIQYEMDLPSAESMLKPELSIQGLKFSYPAGDSAGLRKGHTGYLQFFMTNNGTADAGAVEAVIMQPYVNTDLAYHADLPVTHLNAGSRVEVSIPVTYLANNAQTPGIEKPGSPETKFRLFLQDSLGTYSSMREVSFTLSTGAEEKVNSGKTMNIEFQPDRGGRNYLLIIAIDNYLHWPKLQNAVRDAESVKDVLLKKYRFAPDYLFELVNADASREKIRNALIKIRQEMTKDDNLIIYYAGHGDYNTDYNMGEWIPYDANLSDIKDYFPNSELIGYLRSLPSRHIILLADACFSGSLFVSDAEITYQEYNDKIRSRWGLSSGNMEYVSDGAAGEGSPFAEYLIKALKDNKRDRISVSELVGYVKVMVKNVSDQSPVGKPLRGVGNEGGDYIFYTK